MALLPAPSLRANAWRLLAIAEQRTGGLDQAIAWATQWRAEAEAYDDCQAADDLLARLAWERQRAPTSRR